MLQTIKKIGRVLDLFTVEKPEWGVSEVAEALEMPRSSAHVLLSSLVETGLLQSRDRGRYRIGWRVAELNETLRGTVDVRSVASPILEQLVDQYGETAHLAIMERSRVLYIDKVAGTHMVHVLGARVGAQLEPHCSAVGKVLLAHRTSYDIEQILSRTSLRRLTSATITDPVKLREELASVRRTGIAYDIGEAVSEVHCVAAPVRDGMGVVVAAVSVTVPRSRFEPARAEFTDAIKSAAAEINVQLSSAEDAPVRSPLDDPTSFGAPRSVPSKSSHP